VRAVPVDREQSWRRLWDRVVSQQVVIGVVALAIGIVLAAILGPQSVGPRSSAGIGLIVFGGMLAAVVIRRRLGRPGRHRDDTDSLDVD
jgi:hypothetical protein